MMMMMMVTVVVMDGADDGDAVDDNNDNGGMENTMAMVMMVTTVVVMMLMLMVATAVQICSSDTFILSETLSSSNRSGKVSAPASSEQSTIRASSASSLSFLLLIHSPGQSLEHLARKPASTKHVASAML